MLVNGLPGYLFKDSVEALGRIRQEFVRLYNAAKDLDPDETNMAEVEKLRRKRYFEEQGISVETYAKITTTFFWAQQGNTLPTACWTLAYILADPKVNIITEKIPSPPTPA
jgi:hypothetical protein